MRGEQPALGAGQFGEELRIAERVFDVAAHQPQERPGGGRGHFADVRRLPRVGGRRRETHRRAAEREAERHDDHLPLGRRVGIRQAEVGNQRAQRRRQRAERGHHRRGHTAQRGVERGGGARDEQRTSARRRRHLDAGADRHRHLVHREQAAEEAGGILQDGSDRRLTVPPQRELAEQLDAHQLPIERTLRPMELVLSADEQLDLLVQIVVLGRQRTGGHGRRNVQAAARSYRAQSATV